MSYWDVAEMAADYDLTLRCAACAAQEGIPEPMQWAQQHQLLLCAAPGWDDAWSSYRDAQSDVPPAEDGTPAPQPTPGRDAGVITDEQILAAVQELYATQQRG